MNRIVLLVIVLFLDGCGGGTSGNSNPKSSTAMASSALSSSVMSSSAMSSSAMSSSTLSSSQSSVNREFGLHKLNSVKPGTVFESRLEAINSLGYTVVGHIWIINRAEELLNGILVTPRIIQFIECSGDCSGSNSLFPKAAWSFTYYIETATGNLISFKQHKQSGLSSEEVVLDCRSVSPYQMPSVIKSGDFGSTTGFDCGPTMIDASSWAAFSIASDQIVLSIKYKGYGGVRTEWMTEIEEFEILYTIDVEGNILSISAGGLSSQVVN